MAEPLIYRRFTPGMSALGCTLLLLKPPKIGGNRSDDDPVLRDLEFDAAEDGGDVDYGRIAAHAGAPQIDFDAAEHGGDVAAAKIVRGHLTLHAAEDGVLIQRAFVRARRDCGGPQHGRRQAAPQHQQAGADQHQRPEIRPREVEEAERVGQKQAADPHQNAAGGAPLEYGESTILASPAAIRITGQKRQMSCM